MKKFGISAVLALGLGLMAGASQAQSMYLNEVTDPCGKYGRGELGFSAAGVYFLSSLSHPLADVCSATPPTEIARANLYASMTALVRLDIRHESGNYRAWTREQEASVHQRLIDMIREEVAGGASADESLVRVEARLRQAPPLQVAAR